MQRKNIHMSQKDRCNENRSRSTEESGAVKGNASAEIARDVIEEDLPGGTSDSLASLETTLR